MSFFYSLLLHPYGACWGRICSPQDYLPAGAFRSLWVVAVLKEMNLRSAPRIHFSRHSWNRWVSRDTGFTCLLRLPFRRQNHPIGILEETEEHHLHQHELSRTYQHPLSNVPVTRPPLSLLFALNCDPKKIWHWRTHKPTALYNTPSHGLKWRTSRATAPLQKWKIITCLFLFASW